MPYTRMIATRRKKASCQQATATPWQRKRNRWKDRTTLRITYNKPPKSPTTHKKMQPRPYYNPYKAQTQANNTKIPNFALKDKTLPNHHKNKMNTLQNINKIRMFNMECSRLMFLKFLNMGCSRLMGDLRKMDWIGLGSLLRVSKLNRVIQVMIRVIRKGKIREI